MAPPKLRNTEEEYATIIHVNELLQQKKDMFMALLHQQKEMFKYFV